MAENGANKVFDSISRILIVQTWVSGVLALAIILSAVAIPLVGQFTDRVVETPAEIRDWGGVIIGFYFGSALTQMGTLLSSLRRTDSDRSSSPTDSL
jgi:hypothetical protein